MKKFIDRTGETVIANNGQKMTIIAYRKSKDIDVQFEDKTVIKHKNYSSFKNGTITNPNYAPHIGETNIANNGKKMTIIAYRNWDDIDIQFEDKTVVKHKRYNSFKRGYIKNPNYFPHVGETSVSTNGQKMTIIAYRGYNDIVVKFDDGIVIKHRSYHDFKNGNISNHNFHVGETSISTNGQKMTIIAYRNYKDINVKFEDGYVAKHKNYEKFKKGYIRNPNFTHIRETTIATNGQKMTIIAYRSSRDLDVQFEDNTIVKHRAYCYFNTGIIRNPNFILGKTIINGWLIMHKAYKNKNNLWEYIVYNKETNETDIKNLRELYDTK